MYSISQLAQKLGLSRSTLLYYEKRQLIKGTRQSNGYRSYTDKDFQQLKLLQQLQAGGLTLAECQACLNAQIDREALLHRLSLLDAEIAQKQQARRLLSAMLGMDSMTDWHQSLEQQAPLAHSEWLMKQGFSEKQVLQLKWLSKDMNQHEQYMADFQLIFSGLERLGPGGNQDSLTALSSLDIQRGRLLEIGCGNGITSQLLAKHSQFAITALDNDERYLNQLNSKLKRESQRLAERITPLCASMTTLPFADKEFDVIWAEGSAYIMGVEQALTQWQPYVSTNGYLVFSDLIWLTDKPDKTAKDYWHQAYPQMCNLEQLKQLIKQSSFRLIKDFTLSEQAWQNYLSPLRQKVEQVAQAGMESKALTDIKQELAVHQNYLGQYGYQMFILKNHR